MEHKEELIRNHTKDLKNGAKRLNEMEQTMQEIIKDQHHLCGQINDLQNAIGKKDLTNGYTAKELEQIKQTNKSVHEKLDGIIADIGFLKGQETGSKDIFDKHHKLITLFITICLFTITILEIINII